MPLIFDYMATFDNLTWYSNGGRDEAQIDFSNGWGAHVYKDFKGPDKHWRYAGSLLKKGEYYTGDPWHLCYKRNMTPEMVTKWIRKVQELK